MNDNLGIADKVNIDNIAFEKRIHTKKDKAIITYAPSNKVLHINPKMVKFLSIENWTHVLVGVDQDTGILILKLTDAEEYGSVEVKVLKESRKEERFQDRAKRCRNIYIGHLGKSGKIDIKKQTAFRAERSGEIIFLEQVS